MNAAGAAVADGPVPPALERIERATRLAYQGAGWTLLLTLLLPSASGDGALRWLWEGAEGSGRREVGGLLAVLLRLSPGVAALVLSVRQPFARRGFELLVVWGRAGACGCASWAASTAWA